MLEIFILSFVQGVTEFLPISSSSHLILISELSIFVTQNFLIDISLHIGSFIAVVIFFNREVFGLIKNKELLLKLILATAPLIIIGYIFINFGLVNKLRTIHIIGWSTLIFGILLFVGDKFKSFNTFEKNFSIKTALIIGFAQVLSIIPGVSRSGITITAARLLKFNRVDSAKISFLISIPSLGAVTLYGLFGIYMSENIEFKQLNFISILSSFIFSYLTIKYFLVFLKRFSMLMFVIYRVILGLIIIFYAYI